MKKNNKINFVSFFNVSGCLIYYRVFVLIWHGLSPWLFHEYHWFFTPYSSSFLIKYNSNIHTTLTWKHKITQAVNVTIHCFFFLHLRGTSHIAGSCLSIGKAGGYSKDQDKKNYGSMNKGRPWKEILAGASRMFVSL